MHLTVIDNLHIFFIYKVHLIFHCRKNKTMRFIFRRSHTGSLKWCYLIAIFFIGLILADPVSAGYVAIYNDAICEGGTPRDIVAMNWWEIPVKSYMIFIIITLFPAITSSVEVINSICILAALGFRKLSEKEIFNNSFRKRIYEYICNNPGSNFSNISRYTKINRGTLRYHINILIRQNRIIEKKSHGFVTYFQNSNRYSSFEQDFFILVKDGTAKEICKILESSPGISRNDLAKRLSVAASTVSWHMERLTGSGIVMPEQGENTGISYFLSEEAISILNSKCYERIENYGEKFEIKMTHVSFLHRG